MCWRDLGLLFTRRERNHVDRVPEPVVRAMLFTQLLEITVGSADQTIQIVSFYKSLFLDAPEQTEELRNLAFCLRTRFRFACLAKRIGQQLLGRLELEEIDERLRVTLGNGSIEWPGALPRL